MMTNNFTTAAYELGHPSIEGDFFLTASVHLTAPPPLTRCPHCMATRTSNVGVDCKELIVWLHRCMASGRYSYRVKCYGMGI